MKALMSLILTVAVVVTLKISSSYASTIATILTETECQALRSNVERSAGTSFTVLPCECRVPTTEPRPCHPRCCPKSPYYDGDRCHEENIRSWTPYEQTQCRPPTTTQNYLNDGVCWRTYGSPMSVEATRVSYPSTSLSLTFLLSLKSEHFCYDLFISPCVSSSSSTTHANEVMLRKPEGAGSCWMTCPPQPISPCTSRACYYNRGRTHPFIRRWAGVPDLPTGDYALVCQSVFRITGTSQSDGAEVNQTVFSATPFTVPP
eukprot:PhM_4_TR7345/c0_g1_i1/m.15662